MASLKYKTQNGYEPIPAQVVTKTNAQQGNGIGTCSTSSGTVLAVTLANYELVLNGFIAVTFDHDVPASATLNVNGKGAKPIIYKGSAIEDNVIKEDDTVIFCYDGTNYVVTSLGGESGSSSAEEYVLVNLISSEFTQAGSLIGATVVITDDSTSETILSTTWQGAVIALTINEGVNYTVTVGNISGFRINSNYQSYMAVDSNVRSVIFKYLYNFVGVRAVTTTGEEVEYSKINTSSPSSYVGVSIRDEAKNVAFFIRKTLPTGTSGPAANIANSKACCSRTSTYWDQFTAFTDVSGDSLSIEGAANSTLRAEAQTDYNNGKTGIVLTNLVVNNETSDQTAVNNAYIFCRSLANPVTNQNNGYIGSMQEWIVLNDNQEEVKKYLSAIGGTNFFINWYTDPDPAQSSQILYWVAAKSSNSGKLTYWNWYNDPSYVYGSFNIGGNFNNPFRVAMPFYPLQ